MSALSVRTMLCCGWRELGYLASYNGDFNTALKSLCANDVATPKNIYCGALLFTAATSKAKYGDIFAADIEKHGLGVVKKLPSFKNPNTRRLVQPYMWILDRDNLISYCKKHELFTNFKPYRPCRIG